MSRATELAAAEAARAEAENPDEPATEPETPSPDEDEEQEAEEQETPPEPAPPEQEPVTEARLKSIAAKRDKEDERHETALRKIMGDLFEGHEVCPLCLATGWLVPFEPGTFDPGQRLAVEAAMGLEPAADFREAKDAHRCETCDGWGEVLSGARRDATRTVECIDCGALGYVREAPSTNIVQIPMVTYPQPTASGTAGYAAPNLDNWGRPLGHPDWGRDPAQVNAYGA